MKIRGKKKKKGRLKKGSAVLDNPLYINANLIFSMSFQWLHAGKKNGTLIKLQEDGFQLVTSMLAKYEVVKRLPTNKKLNISKSEASALFDSLMNEYNIMVITSLNKKEMLTDDFFTRAMKSNLDFRDALHIEIAKRWNMKVCTHDKKMIKCTQTDKEKFYKHVYKASDLIRPRKKKS